MRGAKSPAEICLSERHAYVPVARFPEGALARVDEQTRSLRSRNIKIVEPPASRNAIGKLDAAQAPLRRAPVLVAEQENDFLYLWARGIPIVVRNVRIKGDWSPARFAATHGEEEVWVIESSQARTAETKRKTKCWNSMSTKTNST